MTSVEVERFVRQCIQGSRLVEEVGSELTFILPTHRGQTANFQSFFKHLHANRANLHVASYGICDTTLEEVSSVADPPLGGAPKLDFVMKNRWGRTPGPPQKKPSFLENILDQPLRLRPAVIGAATIVGSLQLTPTFCYIGLVLFSICYFNLKLQLFSNILVCLAFLDDRNAPCCNHVSCKYVCPIFYVDCQVSF